MWSRVSLTWSRLMIRWARRRWPRLPLWSRRTVLNVVGSVVAVAVAVAALLLAVLTHKGHAHVTAGAVRTTASTATLSAVVSTDAGPSSLLGEAPVASSVAGSASVVPTGTGSTGAVPTGTGSASAVPTEDAARQVVLAYLNAVNARNRVQAGALICQSLQPTWLQNAGGANSDFNFTVTKAAFDEATPQGGGTFVLHYTLEFNDSTTNDVDFTVIDENGPKICGEQKA